MIHLSTWYSKVSLWAWILRTPSQFTFLFAPFYKYGAYSSTQDGGYLNVATFNDQVDPSEGLSLQIYRDEAHERYRFFYFLIEIL